MAADPRPVCNVIHGAVSTVRRILRLSLPNSALLEPSTSSTGQRCLPFGPANQNCPSKGANGANFRDDQWLRSPENEEARALNIVPTQRQWGFQRHILLLHEVAGQP